MKHLRWTKILLLFVAFALAGSIFFAESSEAASLKLYYNNKNHTYKGKQLKTTIDGVSVTKGKKKGIIINGTCMISYQDVFKKGAGVSCTYNKSKKKLTMKKNGVTIKLWLGKKYAYVNGKKKKLTTAPVQVKYKKGNVTRILVPAKFVATTLKYKYTYVKSTGYVNLKTPFKIKVGDQVTYYTNYCGNVSYNGKVYDLTTMPAMKIGSGTLVPAKEVFSKILGLSYEYDSTAKTIKLTNADSSISIVLTLGSNVAMVNGQAVTTSVVPQKIKRYDTKKTVICVPSNFLSKKFGYYYSWDKTSYTAKIHVKSYFSWESSNQKYDTSKYFNALYRLTADYNNTNGAITIQLTGTNAETMKSITVAKSGKNVVVTVPNSIYNCNQTSFNQFGEIVDQLTIKQNSVNTIITFESANDLDYAYSVTDYTFKIELFGGEYVGTYSLRIPKPSGVTFEQVSNTDYYENKKFVIYITGNHVDYFQANPIAISNNKITSLTTTLTSGGNTAITVQCNTLQGYKIYDKADGFYVAMDTPKKIYNKIVVLDAGHGGSDPGAVANKTNEKDLNYLMIYTLMKKYFSSNAPDIKAYWTRTTDTFITLSNRAAFAKKVGADIFVSLHMNCWSKSSVNGTEVYYSDSNNKSSFSGITSKKMASLFCKRLVSAMGTTNRGISSQKYTVVHTNTVPAVLLELGFLSGTSDFPKLSNPLYQETATRTIYNTIDELFRTYPTGR